MANQIINVGDRVFVRIPEKDTKENWMLKRFEGKVMTVKRVIRHKKGGSYIYELENAVSKYMIDYWFMPEWLDLIPNEEK